MSNLKLGDNNRQVCTICHSGIKEDVERISFSYSTRWGSSYIRICGYCILRLADQVSEPTKEKFKSIKDIKNNLRDFI